MHTPVAPLLTALLALAAPPPPQTTTTRSPGDNTVESVGGKTFHQWTDDLKNPDPSVREEAIRALVRFGHDTPRAIPLLIDRLQDNDSSPRVKAAIALGMIDVPKEDVPKVVLALSQRLSLPDSQSAVRYYAAVSLNNFGEDARYGQVGLVRGVTDPATWEIRHACVSALRVAGRDANGGPNVSVERALIQALHDPTYRVRLEAILAIGALGKPEDSSLFASVARGLEERLTDRDHAVKIWAHVALMALSDVTDKSLKVVIKYLKDPDPKVRIEAARGLGAIGSKLKAKTTMVEPALIAALEDKEVTVIGAAAKALAELEERSDSARTALLDLLKNPDSSVRGAGAQALGAVGIKARIAVPTLTQLVLDKDQPPYVVASACWALGKIGDRDAATVAALNTIAQRKDVDQSLKDVAIEALEQINKLKK
jgi:HEAT repeat protein